MTGEKQNQTGSEVCSIRIMFPVTSDQQAIDYKQKISEVLEPVENVQFSFTIMSSPTRPPIG